MWAVFEKGKEKKKPLRNPWMFTKEEQKKKRYSSKLKLNQAQALPRLRPSRVYGRWSQVLEGGTKGWGCKRV